MRNPSQKGAFFSSNHVADSLILADIHGKTDGGSCVGWVGGGESTSVNPQSSRQDPAVSDDRLSTR